LIEVARAATPEPGKVTFDVEQNSKIISSLFAS
jgi:hypothetical protein